MSSVFLCLKCGALHVQIGNKSDSTVNKRLWEKELLLPRCHVSKRKKTTKPLKKLTFFGIQVLQGFMGGSRWDLISGGKSVGELYGSIFIWTYSHSNSVHHCLMSLESLFNSYLFHLLVVSNQCLHSSQCRQLTALRSRAVRWWGLPTFVEAIGPEEIIDI